MSHKKVKDTDEAWKVQDMHDDKPHGWIQWKGTDVCMDVQCVCGAHNHVDGDFAYHVQCPKCKRVYMCNGHIEFIELEEMPDYGVVVAEGDDENDTNN